MVEEKFILSTMGNSMRGPVEPTQAGVQADGTQGRPKLPAVLGKIASTPLFSPTSSPVLIIDKKEEMEASYGF